jgi:hypothetical protein
MLALAAGGVAVGAVTSGHGAQTASAQSTAASNHLEASVTPTTGHAISNPWMY